MLIILMVVVQNHRHYLQFLYHLSRYLHHQPPVNPHLLSRVTHPFDTHPQPQRLRRCCSVHSRGLGQGLNTEVILKVISSIKIGSITQINPDRPKNKKIPSIPASPCRQSSFALTWTLLTKLGEGAAVWVCLLALWGEF